MRASPIALAAALTVGGVNAALSVVPGATWTAVSGSQSLEEAYSDSPNHRRTPESTSKLMAQVSCKLN